MLSQKFDDVNGITDRLQNHRNITDNSGNASVDFNDSRGMMELYCDDTDSIEY